MDGGNQGADTNSCGTQIVDLIDFQTGINLVGAGENIADLVSGYRIQTAAKRV